MIDNITDGFIELLFEHSQKELPERVIQQANRCLVDYIGVTIAGNNILLKNHFDLFSRICDPCHDSYILGTKYKADLTNSVFLNGFGSHLLELDDGTRFGGIHPGAPILSALLPYSLKKNISYNKLIKAIIIGYEAAIRVASAIQPYHYNRGYHPSGTCGAIGAAVAISVAKGYSKNDLKLSFTAAALSSSGTLKVLEDDSELKPLNIANAAMHGLLATYIAKSCFSSPQDVFSGQSGFINVMSGEIDKQLLLNESKKYSIEKVYFKAYAACRHCHCGIEAALKIRGHNQFDEEKIDRVVIKSYDYVINKHDHTDINSTSSAKMSIPYSVAAALVYGSGSDYVYDADHIHNEKVQNILQRSSVVEECELTKLVPAKRPAIVEVLMKDGTSLVERVDFAIGEPENPMSDYALKQKFIELLIQYTSKGSHTITNIADDIMENKCSMDELTKFLIGDE